MDRDDSIDYNTLKNGGFMRQRQKYLFSLRLHITGGNLTSEQLIALSEAAKKYGHGKVHLTARQGVEIPYIHLDDIEHIKEDLERAGLSHGVRSKVRTVTACQGSTVCPSGLIDSQALAQQIDRRYYGMQMPHKFKFAVTGCPSNCLKTQENDIGITGGIEPALNRKDCLLCGLCAEVCPMDAIHFDGENIELRRESCNLCSDCISVCPSDAWTKGNAGYILYVGGKMGRRPRFADKLAELLSETQLFETIDRVINFYVEKGRPQERLGDTIERVGLEELRKAAL